MMRSSVSSSRCHRPKFAFRWGARPRNLSGAGNCNLHGPAQRVAHRARPKSPKRGSEDLLTKI